MIPSRRRQLPTRSFRAVALTGACLFVLGAGGAVAQDRELVVFDWAGYEDPAFHPAYTEAHGASPTFAFFGDEEEAFQKLRAGFRADIAHPCSQSLVKWREAGLLRPIDTARLAAWDDVLPELRGIEGLEAEGETWFVPYDWGNTALIYRTDLVDEADIGSLQIFADPAYAGRVSLPDNVDDAYALGALAIGLHDWTGMTDEQFEAASAFLRAAAENVRMYWTDNTELAQAMATGEVTLAWGWNETPVQLAADGYPVAMNRDTAEGLSTWVCGYVLLADGEGSDDKAYDFLNAILDPEAGAYLLTEWGYGHGNARAMEIAGAEAVAEMGYGDFAEFTDRTLFSEPLPEPLRQRMIAEFERIKAGF